MGNYRSRPQRSCSEELLRKIFESYFLLEEKLKNDLFMNNNIDMYSIQKAIGSEMLNERSINGQTLLHFCCNTFITDKNLQRPEECLIKVEDSSSDTVTEAPCILQLYKKEKTNCEKDSYILKRKSNRKSHCCSNKDASQIREEKDLAQLLLCKGADPAIISKNGFSPLHLACYKGDIELVSLFLDHCSHLDHTGAGSVTALHLACLAGHLEVTQILAQRGANIEARDAVSFSPLHIACLFGNEGVVEYLLAHGVDVNITGSVGDRPLHLACFGGYPRIVQLLLNKGARVKAWDEEGNTPLHYCARGGHNDILNLLLQPQFKSDVHIGNIYLDTPLHIACYNGFYNCAKTLLTYGGSTLLLKENLWGETPIHSVCTGGKSMELLRFLLSIEGAYINHQGFDGHTPLHSACFHGHVKFVQMLLSHGADLNITTREHFIGKERKQEEQTPLAWAYDQGHDQIVSLLKHFRRPGAHEDYARGEYLGGIENTYFPLPSPIGKLRTVVQEKLDVLVLRQMLPEELHLNLSDIEFVENIGSGSFGKVFKGKYKNLFVAVKRYRTNVNYGKSDVEMFCREVSILGSLNSPYIVKFVGACLQDPSQFAIVTEFVNGGSLFSTIHEQKISLDMVTKLNIVLDVAKGMLYLHTLPQPIIHRDLNSHNILLCEKMRARVADFGESRFVRNIFEENMTKQPGNLRWMAPEVFTQCTRYSIKADVFSFGLCLWELLTCELPFAHLKPAAAAADMAYK
ncbi:Serine/threonine-protein kinase TNNI3K [Armadillidium nasatum]|uniref:Serine/threonine-protein kinase TNNI3K n=1 Tax=Armadillidium nasatum TaxID=96803 RepID=A0A5N5THS0_9CRUS|nr:Serine/threonine-protein kinase TNNI3K [Armadillidium nasatum]